MYTASGGLCAVGMWPFCFRTIKQKGYKWQICKINHTLFGLKNQCVGDWFFFPENQWRKVRTFGDQPTKPNGQAKPSSQTAKLLNSERNNVLNKKETPKLKSPSAFTFAWLVQCTRVAFTDYQIRPSLRSPISISGLSLPRFTLLLRPLRSTTSRDLSRQNDFAKIQRCHC